LINLPHEEEAIRRTLSHLPLEKHFRNIGIDEIIGAVF
jgi:lipoate---protein ligase